MTPDLSVLAGPHVKELQGLKLKEPLNSQTYCRNQANLPEMQSVNYASGLLEIK